MRNICEGNRKRPNARPMYQCRICILMKNCNQTNWFMRDYQLISHLKFMHNV
jgi:hypothetical protein